MSKQVYTPAHSEFMARLVDNNVWIPNPYKEEEDIVIPRVTEKEIEEAFPVIPEIKIQFERKKKNETKEHLCYRISPQKEI